MKYLVIESYKGKMDEWVDEFDTADEAIEYADREFDRMTKNEKKSLIKFCVLESVNPDEDADDHYDGNPIKEYI